MKEIILVHSIHIPPGRKFEDWKILEDYKEKIPQIQKFGSFNIYNYYLMTEFESKIDILDSTENYFDAEILEKTNVNSDCEISEDFSEVDEYEHTDTTTIDQLTLNLNKTITYSEYIAEQLSQTIDYCEYLAENMNLKKFDNFNKKEKIFTLEPDMSIKPNEPNKSLDDLIIVDESDLNEINEWEIKPEEKIDNISPTNKFDS